MAIGGPEQLLSHFKRQAEQLLEVRSELEVCQAQLQECQAELQQLQDEQRQGRVAPFRREPAASPKALKRPGRQPGHPGEWRRSPPAAQTTGSRLKSAQQQHRRDFLETRFAQLLAQPRPSDTPQGRQEEKVRHRLAKQQDHLLTFLDFPALEATNNLAERQLRPVVISRKLSCGNKTMKGATTWSVLASLAATCQQRGDSFIEQVAHAMRLKNRAA